MLKEAECTDEDDSLAPQMEKIDYKVVQTAGQQRPNHWIIICQHCQQKKEIKGVKDAEAYVGNGALDGLKLFKITKHPANTETPPALNVQEVMVNVDQNSTNAKQGKFAAAHDG
jgi:hypothetical protein